MNKNLLKIIKLFAGLFVYAVGIVMTINVNLGLAPWDAFNQGFGIVLGITIGRATILVGLAIVIIDQLVGEKIGWGTVSNMVFIGLFIDFLMLNNLIPRFEGFIPSLIMLILGAFVIGLGAYLYIDAGLGSGPRDGLVVFIVKKTNRSVRVVKSSIDIIVATIGYMLGASIGLGTIIMAFSAGYFMQLAFRINNFDVKEVEHRYIEDDIRWIKEKLKPKATHDEETFTDEEN